VEVLESVRDNRKTIVESGHGVGKTNVAATVALWFLYNHVDSIVLTTAPTMRQVKAGLWKEIAIQWRHELGGLMTNLKLSVERDRWFAMGFTARQSADAEQSAASMQGYHAPHILVIFDEAAGVLPAFWTAAASLLTNENARFLAIGNPTSTSGKFYQNSLLPSFHKIRISCFEHPNVVHNQEIIPGAVTRQFIEDAKSEWGESTPIWDSRILGKPPDEGDDTLIRLSWVTACINKERHHAQKKKPKIMTIDVARFGQDNTVIGDIIGNNLQENIERRQGKDTNETSGRIIRKWEDAFDSKEPYDIIVIDDSGVGGGVTDKVKAHIYKGKSPTVFAFNGAAASSRPQFANLRAQAYWKLREDTRLEEIALVEFGTLTAELTNIKTIFNGKGQILIESKDEIKKRNGGRSPDLADMVMMGNWARTRGIAGIEMEKHEEPADQDTVFGDIYSENF